MKAYRAALLRFDDQQQPVYESDGLLVIGPDATGRKVVRAAGDHAALADRFPGVAQGIEPSQAYGIVASATHTFNAADSQREVIDLSAQWMLRQTARAPTH